MQGAAHSKIPSISSLKHCYYFGQKQRESCLYQEPAGGEKRRLDRKRSISSGPSPTAPAGVTSEH